MQNVTFVLKTENSFQFSIPFPKLLNSQNAHLVCSRVTAEKSFKGKQTKLFERLISWNLQDNIFIDFNFRQLYIDELFNSTFFRLEIYSP